MMKELLNFFHNWKNKILFGKETKKESIDEADLILFCLKNNIPFYITFKEPWYNNK